MQIAKCTDRRSQQNSEPQQCPHAYMHNPSRVSVRVREVCDEQCECVEEDRKRRDSESEYDAHDQCACTMCECSRLSHSPISRRPLAIGYPEALRRVWAGAGFATPGQIWDTQSNKFLLLDQLVPAAGFATYALHVISCHPIPV